MKAFRVNAEWLEYAHGPGAESAHPLALELLDIPAKRGVVLVGSRDLVEEIIDVAECYLGDSSVQDEDNPLWWRAYPTNVVRRGRKWLRQLSLA